MEIKLPNLEIVHRPLCVGYFRVYETTENLCLKEDLEKNLIFKRLNLSVLISAHSCLPI